jgi:hypothetical protein
MLELKIPAITPYQDKVLGDMDRSYMYHPLAESFATPTSRLDRQEIGDHFGVYSDMYRFRGQMHRIALLCISRRMSYPMMETHVRLSQGHLAKAERKRGR